jgi:hypothetical protein
MHSSWPIKFSVSLSCVDAPKDVYEKEVKYDEYETGTPVCRFWRIWDMIGRMLCEQPIGLRICTHVIWCHGSCIQRIPWPWLLRVLHMAVRGLRASTFCHIFHNGRTVGRSVVRAFRGLYLGPSVRTVKSKVQIIRATPTLQPYLCTIHCRLHNDAFSSWGYVVSNGRNTNKL